MRVPHDFGNHMVVSIGLHPCIIHFQFEIFSCKPTIWDPPLTMEPPMNLGTSQRCPRGSRACKIFCRFHFWTSPQTFSEWTSCYAHVEHDTRKFEKQRALAFAAGLRIWHHGLAGSSIHHPMKIIDFNIEWIKIKPFPVSCFSGWSFPMTTDFFIVDFYILPSRHPRIPIGWPLNLP